MCVEWRTIFKSLENMFIKLMLFCKWYNKIFLLCRIHISFRKGRFWQIIFLFLIQYIVAIHFCIVHVNVKRYVVMWTFVHFISWVRSNFTCQLTLKTIDFGMFVVIFYISIYMITSPYFPYAFNNTSLISHQNSYLLEH